MARRLLAIRIALAGAALLISTAAFHAQSSGSGISLSLAERLGGQGVAAIAPDGAGNFWVVGDATFNPIPVTGDAAQPVMRGSADAFLMKIRGDGSVAYASYLGGSNAENGLAVATDPAGNVYVVGRTSSPDFPVSAGAFSPTSHGDDGFLTKFASDGRSILYSTYIPGTFIQTAAVAADLSGRAHVTGMTLSTSFPVTETIAPNGEVFYMRFGAGGSLEYSTRIGGSGGEQPYGIAVDGGGSAYIVGYTGSKDFTLRRALKSTFPSTAGSQGFLAKFTSAGLDFSTYIGGSGSDNLYAVALSPTGVYVGGAACSWDFPGAPNPRSMASGCDGAAVIAKLKLDGSAYLASRLLNGSGYGDYIGGVGVDADERVYVFGSTNSTDFPVTQDAQQIAAGGAGDAFFARLSMPDATTLQADYVTYFGGTQGDSGRAVLPDGAGGAWVGGWTNSGDWPTLSPSQNSSQSVVAHYAVTGATAPASDDIVLYAKDAAVIAGNWRIVADSTAAGGARIWNPDAGAAKMAAPSPAPANYVDMTFTAQAGVAYHLWLRMKADNDSWSNDSVFVQLSGATDVYGRSIATGTSSGLVVSLEDCTGCGESGWGWNDNGYNQPGVLIKFTTSGTHTIRIQQREDGVSIDQIVLSSRTWINTAPGANKNDSTIVPQGTQPPPANQPPTISLNSPANGATYTAPATLTVSGTATDRDGSIARVDTYINGELKAGGQPATFNASWFGLPAGTYAVRVVAIDNQGADTTTSVTVTVSNSPTPSNQPPTVAITSPANGTTVDQASWPVVNASASDSDGSVARVDFYANSTLLWTDTAAPYRMSWESMPEGTYTLTAVATDNSGASTASVPVTLTVAARSNAQLPSYWTDQDIGDVGAAGSATYAKGTFTIQGSGADVWGTADAFHYADVVTGGTDAAIVARVAGLSGEANWVKAGVMMRASPDPGSAQAFMLVSHAKGVCFQRRVVDGGATTSTCGTQSTAPRWVKLVRAGNVISGYESADGTSWALVGTDTFTSMSGSFAGLAVSSHVRGTLSTATFDHVWVMDAVGPNQPPTVSLTRPSNGATFTAPATISVGMNALDDTSIARIDLYANSALIGSVPGNSSVSDYSFTWSNVPAGAYTLTAIAFDGQGSSTTSAAVATTVNGAPASNQCSSVMLSQTFFYSGGPSSTWRIAVTAADATCTWTASIDQAWLALNGLAGPATITGTGSGSLTLQTTDNHSGTTRVGIFSIGGTAYRVTQEPY